MERRHAAGAAAALVAFVLLSSYLGLAGRFFFVAPLDGFAFMGGIWADSVAADVVFTVGSILAAILGWLLARRHWALSVVGGGLASWAVYTASFLLLDEARGAEPFDLGGAISFVGMWGVVGLLFCAAAPPLARAWWLRRQAAGAPAEAPELSGTR